MHGVSLILLRKQGCFKWAEFFGIRWSFFANSRFVFDNLS